MVGSDPKDVTPQRDNPPTNKGTAKKEPDTADTSKGSPDKNQDKWDQKFQEFDERLKKSESERDVLQRQNEEQRREIGRLGDELGSTRNQVQSTYDIKDIAQKFHQTLLNPEDPESAFRAMVGLINEAFAEKERTERETLQTYDKVSRRNPELAKVPYDEFRNKAILDNVFHEVRSGNAMERYISNLLVAHNTPENIQKRINDAKRQGAEEERNKLELAGLIPKSGGGSPPAREDNGKLTTIERIAINMGITKPS